MIKDSGNMVNAGINCNKLVAQQTEEVVEKVEYSCLAELSSVKTEHVSWKVHLSVRRKCEFMTI